MTRTHWMSLSYVLLPPISLRRVISFRGRMVRWISTLSGIYKQEVSARPMWDLTTPISGPFFSIPHLNSERIMGTRRWHFINPQEPVWLLPLDFEPQGNECIHASEQGVTVKISIKEVWRLSLQEVRAFAYPAALLTQFPPASAPCWPTTPHVSW